MTVGEMLAPLHERPTSPTENWALKTSPAAGISPVEPHPAIAEIIGSRYGLPVAIEEQLKSTLETSTPLAPPANALGAATAQSAAASATARLPLPIGAILTATTCTRQAATAPRLSGLPTRLVVLLAVACGATVANLYYAQPLLDTIAQALDVSSGTAGLHGHRDAGGLRRRAAADRPARGPAGAPQARLAAAGDRRRRAGRGVRRAVARRPRGGARVRRRDERRRAGARPVRVLAGAGGGARARRRAGDERAAARHPARPHGRRPGGRDRRLAADLRARRGGDADARAGAAPRAAAGRAARAAAPTGGCWRSVGTLDPRGAAAAPPDGDRLPLDGELQRAVDRDRVPALGAAVRLRRGGDRPVLARGAGGRGDGELRGAAGRPRPRGSPRTRAGGAGRARRLGADRARRDVARRR